jgi:NAD(P)H-dependent FMN reductase
MLFIPIIIGSIREGRMSPRAAYFIDKRLRLHQDVAPEIVDLKDLNLPPMQERLRFLPNPSAQKLSDALAKASAAVIVTPEYNRGYPGVLKNALDYLNNEFVRKPIGIITVSGGDFGGINCLVQLRSVLLDRGAVPITARFPVRRVQDVFTEDGTLKDPSYEKLSDEFIKELLWFAARLSA